jgi:hypothetical protein
VTPPALPLGHDALRFEFQAVTLPDLDASAYLARPQALAGALAARMRLAAQAPITDHKLACVRRNIEGSEVDNDEVRQLLLDVVEAYLPLAGTDAEHFEQLLQLPENQGVRQTMKTWTEQQQEMGEARGEARGKLGQAREDVLRVLEARLGPVSPAIAQRLEEMDDVAALRALLVRAATASTLEDIGLS